MVEQPKKEQFLANGPAWLSLGDAIGRARMAMPQITSSRVDAVRSCRRSDDGNWLATVEVVEVAARMGDNDLLAAYDLTLDTRGDLVSFHRVERYFREDGAGA